MKAKMNGRSKAGTVATARTLPDVATELDALAHCIAQVRSELRHLSRDESEPRVLGAAHDELDAVICATEQATGQILDACEKIETAAARAASDVADGIIEQVTRVYEACSFQDITGQRISKVVTALKQIEARVGILMDLVSPLAPVSAPLAARAATTGASYGAADRRMSEEERTQNLLEGPQLPGQGVDQDEIDKLLAGNG
jgi:chemotaxis protein CheZ